MSTVNQGNSGQNINQKSPTNFENGLNIPTVDTSISPSDFNGIAIDSVTGNFVHGVSGIWIDSFVDSKDYTDAQFTALQASVQSGTYPAIPTTNPTIAPYVGKYSFQATIAGTYTNFSGIVVSSGDVAVGKETYLESFDSGATWTKRVKQIVDTSEFYTKTEVDGFVKYIGASATSGVDLTGTLVNQVANNPTAYLNYVDVSLNGSKLQSVKFSAKEVGNLLLVHMRKINSSGFFQEVNRYTLATIVGKNTIDMISYNITLNIGDTFGIADSGLTNTPKRQVVSGKSTLAVAINGTSNLYEFTNATFPTEPVSPTNTQIDLQFTYKLPDEVIKDKIAVLESETEELFDAAIKPQETETVGVDNNGTNSLTSGTGLCFSEGAVTLSTGILGIVKLSASGAGSLLIVQMRKSSAGSWNEFSRRTLTVTSGENTIDLTSFSIPVIKDDFFGLVPVSGVNPRWKTVSGKNHWEAPLNVATNKYSFTNSSFPNTPITPDNVQVDLSYTIIQPSETAIELIETINDDLEQANRRIDVVEMGGTTNIIKVSKYGVVGVDGIQYIGNRAIQDAIDNITDASYEKRYIIQIANPSVFEAKTAAEFNAGTAASGADICFIRPKPWIKVRGCDYDNCIISGFLPDNLGTGFAYQNYQTVKWSCDNFEFENVTITGQNLRYAVHSDGGRLGNENYTMKATNCVFEHLGNTNNALTVWNSVYAVGIGTSSGQKFIYDNCTFKSSLAPMQMHTNFNFTMPSIQSYKNCIFWNTGTNMKLADMFGYTSHQQDLVVLDNCKFVNCFIFSNGSDSTFCPALSDLQWNLYEVKYKGFGNDPLLFKNGFNGHVLQIKSKSTGVSSTVSFDVNSTAFPIIIKDKDYVSGSYTNVVNEFFNNGYAVRNGETGLSGYALGLLDVGINAQNGQYLKSLGKRLGDCSTVNKTLTVSIDGTPYNIVFDKNYNGTSTTTPPTYTNDQIVTEITNIIGSVATVQWLYPMDSLNTYGDFQDNIRFAKSSELILKGYGVVIESGLARKATSSDARIDGVALNDFTTGGTGRVLVRGIIETAQNVLQFVKLLSGTAAVVKGDTLGISGTAGQFNKAASFKPFTCYQDGYLWINCEMKN